MANNVMATAWWKAHFHFVFVCVFLLFLNVSHLISFFRVHLFFSNINSLYLLCQANHYDFITFADGWTWHALLRLYKSLAKQFKSKANPVKMSRIKIICWINKWFVLHVCTFFLFRLFPRNFFSGGFFSPSSKYTFHWWYENRIPLVWVYSLNIQIWGAEILSFASSWVY